ncbi:GNAT family N-acetyltransferase [Undibacterium sp. CY18W]|uniref:GNAT family N-acetyltransferase n=1 Tax=Undibacterium hunanense TaxID=2762292 RepID=A0ABR6ZPE6_9BURK|nr:GNAT family N-acetyltransferase [Undibacterium hunanense]MBC3917728.1 GNAT family N-acetyltransferase [Undibacterium hunanense]
MHTQTTTVTIRKATSEDVEAMCELSDQINAQHHAQAPHIFVKHNQRELDRLFWQASFQAAHTCALLACQNDAVIGFITLSWHENMTIPFLYCRRICRIGTIVVSDRHQQQGVGSMLMDAATAWGREHQAVELRLEVFDFNQNAMAFYRAQGYGVQSHIMSKALE